MFIKASSVTCLLTVSSLMLCGVSDSALASGVVCTNKTSASSTMVEMQALTKLSMADAQKTALDAIGAKKVKKIESSELEVEDSCLVYSFDIKLTGSTGVTEVMVDALTGKVISQKKESALQEAAESAADKNK